MIKEYDKVRLKTGQLARIVEIFNDKIFLAEVVAKSGDIDTREVKAEEIVTVFEEIERPFTAIPA